MHVPNNADITVDAEEREDGAGGGCFNIAAVDPEIVAARGPREKFKLTSGTRYPLDRVEETGEEVL